MRVRRIVVMIGESGKRVGESHGRAKLTDHEVELVRQLKEEGMSASEISEKMEIGKRHVYKIVCYETRASVVVQYRTRKVRRKRK